MTILRPDCVAKPLAGPRWKDLEEFPFARAQERLCWLAGRA